MSPVLYWALSNIEQEKIEGGFKITITSDVPSHQWLRSTANEPWKHLSVVERRGLFIHYDARFCFTAYHDLEQEEEGDTLIHTFIWNNWYHCLKRWFYFWATLLGQKMYSTSCIFSKHYTELKVYAAPCSYYDGDAASQFTTYYSTVHDMDGVWSRDNWTSIGCSQQQGSSNYYKIFRGALVFDTTGLDPSWTLDKATLHFVCGHRYDEGGGPLDFVDASGLTLPFLDSNYQELLLKTDILASISRDDINLYDWNVIDLDPSKLSVIKPGAHTIIGIREHHDLINTDGGMGIETTWGFALNTCEYAAGRPYLVIEGH